MYTSCPQLGQNNWSSASEEVLICLKCISCLISLGQLMIMKKNVQHFARLPSPLCRLISIELPRIQLCTGWWPHCMDMRRSVRRSPGFFFQPIFQYSWASKERGEQQRWGVREPETQTQSCLCNQNNFDQWAYLQHHFILLAAFKQIKNCSVISFQSWNPPS